LKDTNTIILVGRLTRDVWAITQNLAGIRVAFNTTRRDGDQYVDQGNFINVKIPQPGGLFDHLTKGTRVAITGHLEERTGDDTSVKEFEIFAHHIQLLGGRSNDGQTPSEHTQVVNNDDIPF
jgi:single-stranded DNA-binding protein